MYGTKPDFLHPLSDGMLSSSTKVITWRTPSALPRSAMARIAERGRALGVRHVMTFVEEDNIPSLKGCKKSGFVPYMIRRERWFLFCRTLTFARLPEGTPYAFDAEGAAR